MSGIIFEYKHTPSYGCFGMPGGNSIVVMDDGSIWLRNYVIGQENPCSEEKITFIPEVPVLIEKVLIKYKPALQKIPGKLDNGSLDSFQLGKKRISSWNITRSDLSEVKDKSELLSDFKENMLHENMVLDIYNEIIDILKSFDLGLNLIKK